MTDQQWAPTYKYCFVPMCTNTSFKTPVKLFLSVPKKEKDRKKWLKAARRTAGMSSTMYCCEDHFDIENDIENYMYVKLFQSQSRVQIKLKPGIIPTKFNCQTSRLVTGRSSHISVQPKLERKRIVKELLEQSESQPAPGEQNQNELPKNFELTGTNQEIDEFEHATNEDDLTVEKFIDKGVQVQPICNSKEVQTRGERPTYKSVYVQARPQYKSQYVQATTKLVSSLTSPLKRQSSPPFSARKKPRVILLSDEEEESLITTSSSSFKVSKSNTTSSEVEYDSLQKHKETTEKISIFNIEMRPKLYLGVEKTSFFIVNLLMEKTNLPYKNILLTIKKLRCNQPFAMIAHDFGISENTASRIFRCTLPKITALLKQLVYWPENIVVKKKLPIPFRKNYSNVISIIDCLEIQIEKPSDPYKQSLTWSEYYRCNTIKYLISCTPNGFVNFVSCGYGGRITDTELTCQSGFLKLLTRGNHVMADRGFKNLSAILQNQGCSLVRPPSVSADTKLSKQEVLTARRIASLRVHVERVIGRCREFKMVLPHSTVDNKLVPYLDCVMYCVSGLINTQSQIL